MMYYEILFSGCQSGEKDIFIMEKAWREYSCWCAETLPQDLEEELEHIKENKDEILDVT